MTFVQSSPQNARAQQSFLLDSGRPGHASQTPRSVYELDVLPEKANGGTGTSNVTPLVLCLVRKVPC